MTEYILGDKKLATVFGELLSNLLDLVGAHVVEADEDDLRVLIEELEAPLDDDLLLVSGLDRIFDHVFVW